MGAYCSPSGDVPRDWTGHAAWTTTAAHQLTTFEGDHRALVLGDCDAAVEKAFARNHREPRALHLAQRAHVPRIRKHEARTQCDEVAARCPLLTLLKYTPRSAREDWRHGHTEISKCGEHVRLLREACLSLLPVQHAETLGAGEIRWKADAQLTVHLRKDHVEMDRRILPRHHDDEDVRDFRLGKEDGRQIVDRARTRSLTEPDDDEV